MALQGRSFDFSRGELIARAYHATRPSIRIWNLMWDAKLGGLIEGAIVDLDHFPHTKSTL